MNKGEWAEFANFDVKIGCHGNVSSAIRKKARSLIYNQMPAIW